uniref:Uncharacterized protein n=1 Tax=Arion vulgaris TaxID=1028688 RepID=A0A0B7B8P3_9EUPU
MIKLINQKTVVLCDRTNYKMCDAITRKYSSQNKQNSYTAKQENPTLEYCLSSIKHITWIAH